MSSAVKLPGMHAVFFLMDMPDDREGLDIEEDAWVEVPMNVGLWPEDASRPETVLCQSREDLKHYKLFKYRGEIEGTEWEETGLSFGGTFSKDAWSRFNERLRTMWTVTAVSDDQDGEDNRAETRIIRPDRVNRWEAITP